MSKGTASTTTNASSKTKFTSKNLNALTKAPTIRTNETRYGGGRLLVLGKTGRSGVTKGGVVNAPTPINTPSLRKENNGQDITITLVPSGGGGWGTSKLSEVGEGNPLPNQHTPTDETPKHIQNPTHLVSKRAPWASVVENSTPSFIVETQKQQIDTKSDVVKEENNGNTSSIWPQKGGSSSTTRSTRSLSTGRWGDDAVEDELFLPPSNAPDAEFPDLSPDVRQETTDSIPDHRRDWETRRDVDHHRRDMDHHRRIMENTAPTSTPSPTLTPSGTRRDNDYKWTKHNPGSVSGNYHRGPRWDGMNRREEVWRKDYHSKGGDYWRNHSHHPPLENGSRMDYRDEREEYRGDYRNDWRSNRYHDGEFHTRRYSESRYEDPRHGVSRYQSNNETNPPHRVMMRSEKLNDEPMHANPTGNNSQSNETHTFPVPSSTDQEKIDEQSEYMKKLAISRAKARRLEEEMRIEEQKKKAFERLAELERRKSEREKEEIKVVVDEVKVVEDEVVKVVEDELKVVVDEVKVVVDEIQVVEEQNQNQNQNQKLSFNSNPEQNNAQQLPYHLEKNKEQEMSYLRYSNEDVRILPRSGPKMLFDYKSGSMIDASMVKSSTKREFVPGEVHSMDSPKLLQRPLVAQENEKNRLKPRHKKSSFTNGETTTKQPNNAWTTPVTTHEETKSNEVALKKSLNPTTTTTTTTNHHHHHNHNHRKQIRDKEKSERRPRTSGILYKLEGDQFFNADDRSVVEIEKEEVNLHRKSGSYVKKVRLNESCDETKKRNVSSSDPRIVVSYDETKKRNENELGVKEKKNRVKTRHLPIASSPKNNKKKEIGLNVDVEGGDEDSTEFEEVKSRRKIMQERRDLREKEEKEAKLRARKERRGGLHPSRKTTNSALTTMTTTVSKETVTVETMSVSTEVKEKEPCRAKLPSTPAPWNTACNPTSVSFMQIQREEINLEMEKGQIFMEVNKKNSVPEVKTHASPNKKNSRNQNRGNKNKGNPNSSTSTLSSNNKTFASSNNNKNSTTSSSTTVLPKEEKDGKSSFNWNSTTKVVESPKDKREEFSSSGENVFKFIPDDESHLTLPANHTTMFNNPTPTLGGNPAPTLGGNPAVFQQHLLMQHFVPTPMDSGLKVECSANGPVWDLSQSLDSSSLYNPFLHHAHHVQQHHHHHHHHHHQQQQQQQQQNGHTPSNERSSATWLCPSAVGLSDITAVNARILVHPEGVIKKESTNEKDEEEEESSSSNKNIKIGANEKEERKHKKREKGKTKPKPKNTLDSKNDLSSKQQQIKDPKLRSSRGIHGKLQNNTVYKVKSKPPPKTHSTLSSSNCGIVTTTKKVYVAKVKLGTTE